MSKIDPRLKVEIKLDFPFEFDGEKVECLTMRRPKVRDGMKAEKVNGGDADRVLALLANVVERPVEVLAELDEVDFGKLEAQYLAFTGRQVATLTN